VILPYEVIGDALWAADNPNIISYGVAKNLLALGPNNTVLAANTTLINWDNAEFLAAHRTVSAENTTAVQGHFQLGSGAEAKLVMNFYNDYAKTLASYSLEKFPHTQFLKAKYARDGIQMS
jgi:hypothetical protein